MRVDHCLVSESHKQVARNRQFLKSVISCLQFCGRQGVSLRGHRDDASSDDHNQGNFKALIQFTISAGDVALDSPLKECSKRSTYTSKTTQNELLMCIGYIIQKEIVAEILAHSDTTQTFFGIQADEVKDVSNWEQLGIILRYVKDRQPVERLLAFIDCESVTGERICESIVDTLRRVNLLPELCRAQTYDGAGNMAGSQWVCSPFSKDSSAGDILSLCESSA